MKGRKTGAEMLFEPRGEKLGEKSDFEPEGEKKLASDRFGGGEKLIYLQKSTFLPSRKYFGEGEKS